MPPTFPEKLEQGMARRELLDPEKKVAGPRRAVEAAYWLVNILTAVGEWRVEPGEPLTCFKSVCWMHVERHPAASGLTGSREPASKESWQSAEGRQAGEDWHRQSYLHTGENQHEGRQGRGDQQWQSCLYSGEDWYRSRLAREDQH